MKLTHGRALGIWWLLAAGLAPGCTCDGTAVNTAEPHANAERTVDLGSVAVGLTVSANLHLRNDGTDTLHIQSTAVEGTGAGVFSVATGGLDVVPRASTTLVLTFRPTAEGPTTATLVIVSNAKDNPTLRVTLTGVGLPPAITVTPLVLDFGVALPGQFKQLPVTLTNTTMETVDATLYVLEDDTQAYQVTGAAMGERLVVHVNALAQVQVQIQFAPNRGGPATGTLRVDSCGTGCGVAVPMTGVMSAPRLNVTPVVLDFGRVATGMTVDSSVTLSNLGTLELSVTSGTLAPMDGAFTLLDALPITLTPGQESVFHIRYNALAPGRSDALLTLDSNDVRTPHAVVSLSGATSGSDVVALPGAINFGVVPNGLTVTRNVLVLNRGDQEASLEAVSLISPQFSMDTNGLPPLPYVLQAGSSLLLTVGFTSSPLGTFNGTLQIATTSVGHEMLTVNLEALRADRACQVSASTAEVNLGAIRLGQQAQQSFTIRNVGTGPCDVTAPVPAPGFSSHAAFSFTGEPSGQMLPGEVRRVNVRFAPAVRGALRAVVQVSVAGEPPVLVTCRGRGSAAGVSVNPAFVDFGSVPINCGVVSRSISVLSDGAEPVLVDAPTVSHAPPFGVVSMGLPANLPPGTAHSLSVTFAPTALGVVTAETRIVGHVPEDTELVVGLRGEGVPNATPVTEHFTVDSHNAMDVLFVVDNSGSMADNQDNLATNAQRFVQVADFRSNVDFQLGVVTTDVSPEAGPGHLVGTPLIITRQTGDAAALFTSRARVGVDGSGDEQGLEAARMALSPPAVDGPNATFLRDQAGLAVVIVSDEEDHSPLTVQQYVDFFVGLKAVTGAPVIISAIAGQPSGCATAQSETRYEDAVVATGGISASICDADWGTKLQRIGEAALLARGRFRLTGSPQPGTVVVKLGTQTLSSGWTFDPQSNSVILDPTSVPAPGTMVTITYVPQC